jgi:thiosulfate dehydrogenase [quinone] large subunit
MAQGPTSGPAAPVATWSPRQPDGTVAAGWYLAPLRLFLGVTFLFAGLQKLANPAFFRASSPISIHAQLVGATHSSPIHALIAHLVPAASAVGAAIALGEVAIGLGVLLGLWMRVAAIVGMALSFGLFLTVSFHSSPYFTGSDIVFFFAWTPLALAGAAGAPALDTWLAGQSTSVPVRPGAVPRREVVSKGAITGIVAAVVLLGGGVAAALGRIAGGTTAATGSTGTLGGGSGTVPTTAPTATGGTGTSPTTAAAPSGTSVGSASSVPVGGAASFTDPASGDPSLVIQQTADDFVGFDAVCPHAGCTVAYQPSARIIACPCHGSEFNPNTGAVIRGPATYGLTPIKVIKGADGNLYVPK